MSIYKGNTLVSGKIGGVGPPGMNSSGGTDIGSIIIEITPASWLYNGTEYIRKITRAEHHMAASPALLAFTATYNDDYSELERVDGHQMADLDGTITLKSNYPWYGICVIAGGIAQTEDIQARKLVEDETERAKQAEAQALADAKKYADQKVADTVAASQTWLPSVKTVAELPSVTDTSKTYLCRVTQTNDVYQCVAGQTAWTIYSDNTDYIDEQELAEAVQGETDRATAAEKALGEQTTKLREYVDDLNTPFKVVPVWTGSVNNYSYTLSASAHGKGATPRVTTLLNGSVIDCAPTIDSVGNITIYANTKLEITMEVR